VAAIVDLSVSAVCGFENGVKTRYSYGQICQGSRKTRRNGDVGELPPLSMNLVAADVSPLTLDRGKFEPTHLGCCKAEPVHGPNACARATGGFPQTNEVEFAQRATQTEARA